MVAYTVRPSEGWRSVAEAVIDELLPLACGLDLDAIVDGGVMLPPSAENAVSALEAIAQELRSWPKGKQRVVALAGLQLDPNELEHRRLFRDAALWVIDANMWTRRDDNSCSTLLVSTSDTGSDFSFQVSDAQLETVFKGLIVRGLDPHRWIGPAEEIWNYERVKSRTAHLFLSYHEVGHTRIREVVDGYRMTDLTGVVGTGMAAFQRAVDCVVSLSMHRAAGLDVTADTSPIAEGTNLVLGHHFGPIRLRAPCRVVYVIDTPTMGGFAYGRCPAIRNKVKRGSRWPLTSAMWSRCASSPFRDRRS